MGSARQRPVGTPNLGTLLRDPFLLFNARLMDHAAGEGFGDLRIAHTPVFQHVRDSGSRITELAERAQLSKATVVYLVNDLEALGYVERVSDPADGRAKLVRPTERGRAAVAAARTVVGQLEEEWAQLLGAAKMARLRRLLEDLHAALWPPENGTGGGR